MSSRDRRQILMDRVREHGYVTVGGLAREFCVDGSTIRRDLAHLERAGLIRRTHGGVLPADPEDAVDIPYNVRQHDRLRVKAALASAAAQLVDDGQTVLLDSGSTMYHLAAALRARQHLTVITNDLYVGVRSAGHPTNRLHVLGGTALETVYTLIGPETVTALAGLHVDWTFLGAEAIDANIGVTNINAIEVPVKRAMIEAAEHVVLVADSTKFGRRALSPVCSIADLSMVLTDDELPAASRAAFGPRLRCVPVRS
jgi:DeoR family transcriptional regulator, aga operon transcriptional repressor